MSCGKFVEWSYMPPMPPVAHSVLVARIANVSAPPSSSAGVTDSSSSTAAQRTPTQCADLPSPSTSTSVMATCSRMRTLGRRRTAESSLVVISRPVMSAWKAMRGRLCAPSRVKSSDPSSRRSKSTPSAIRSLMTERLERIMMSTLSRRFS